MPVTDCLGSSDLFAGVLSNPKEPASIHGGGAAGEMLPYTSGEAWPGSCANYPCGEGEYMGCASNWLHPAYGLPSGPDQPTKSLHDPSMHPGG